MLIGFRHPEAVPDQLLLQVMVIEFEGRSVCDRQNQLMVLLVLQGLIVKRQLLLISFAVALNLLDGPKLRQVLLEILYLEFVEFSLSERFLDHLVLLSLLKLLLWG